VLWGWVPVLFLWAPMFAWFLALRPGVMNLDSIDVWHQVQTGSWIDWHPPVLTAVNWLSWRLMGTPSLATLLYSLALAAAMAHLVRVLVRCGSPKYLTWGVAFVIALSPTMGAFSVHVMKDVPYAACFLVITALIAHAVLPQPRGTPVPITPLAVLVSAFSVCMALLVRPNGIVMVVLVAPGAVLVVREHRRLLAVSWLAAFIIFVLMKTVVYPAAGVRSSPPHLSAGVAIFDLAALAASDPDQLPARDVALLTRLAPLERWQTLDCHWSGRRVPYDQARAMALAPELQAAWRRALLRQPLDVLGIHFCASSPAWNPWPSWQEKEVFETVYWRVATHRWANLETHPVWDGYTEFAQELIRDAADPAWQWLKWRPATWMYLGSILMLVGSALRRSWRPLLVLVPLYAQTASVVVMLAANGRYHAPAWIAAVLLVPFSAYWVYGHWTDRSDDRSAGESVDVSDDAPVHDGV
jgi:hypothetical protein